ncbi:hypothetical protein BpHYR1_048386, partial [Brachionus plicatilis]
MIREIRTFYVALIIMVSRKIYYWARNNEEEAVLSFQDNFTQDIRFNPPPESIPIFMFKTTRWIFTAGSWSQSINKLSTIKSGDENPETRVPNKENKRLRFYSTESEDLGRISNKENPENSKNFRIFQLTQPTREHIHSRRPEPIREVCKINNQVVAFDLDTEAHISAISKEAYDSLQPQPKLVTVNREIYSAGGVMDNVLGLARVDLHIGNDSVSSHLLVVENLMVDCLLGRDLLPYSSSLKNMSKLIQKKIQAVSEVLLMDKDGKGNDSTDKAKRSITKRMLENPRRGSRLVLNCIKDNLDEVASTVEMFKTKLGEVSASCLLELKQE